jgi:hypothetical protein
VGQALGGPWTYIGPAAGFGVGLLADMKLMHRMHQKPGAQRADTAASTKADADLPPSNQPASSAPTSQGAACCGIASGLTRMFGSDEPKNNEALRPTDATATSRPDTDPPSQSARPSLAEAASTVEPAGADRAKAA